MDKEKVTEELVRQNGNQAAVVMADFAGGGGGGSVPKFSDFAVREDLTLEEKAQWEAANPEIELAGDCFKVNKKALERLLFLSFGDGGFYVTTIDNIREFGADGSILAFYADCLYLAKSSSMWDVVVVPETASDDYFYYVEFKVRRV